MCWHYTQLHWRSLLRFHHSALGECRLIQLKQNQPGAYTPHLILQSLSHGPVDSSKKSMVEGVYIWRSKRNWKRRKTDENNSNTNYFNANTKTEKWFRSKIHYKPWITNRRMEKFSKCNHWSKVNFMGAVKKTCQCTVCPKYKNRERNNKLQHLVDCATSSGKTTVHSRSPLQCLELYRSLYSGMNASFMNIF